MERYSVEVATQHTNDLHTNCDQMISDAVPAFFVGGALIGSGVLQDREEVWLELTRLSAKNQKGRNRV